MIIQIRGTSGSGKSWVVHNLREHLEWELKLNPYSFWEERKRTPSWYEYEVDPKNKIVLLGQYETNCGGVDNIGASAPRVFPYMQEQQSKNSIVFAEGLLLSEDVIWTEQLDDPILILHLQTDVQTCYNNVMERKAETGRGSTDKARIWRKLDTRVQTIDRACARLRALSETRNIVIKRCSSKQALKICKGILDAFVIPF